jgi:hypothetical protein
MNSKERRRYYKICVETAKTTAGRAFLLDSILDPSPEMQKLPITITLAKLALRNQGGIA